MFSVKKPNGRFFFEHKSLSSMTSNKLRDIANIYPQNPDSAMCAALLLMNLADPAWIKVECDEQLKDNFLCYFEGNTVTGNEETYMDKKIFNELCVMRNKHAMYSNGLVLIGLKLTPWQ